MIPWNDIAKDLGARDPEHMWRTLYPKYSIAQLAVKFAVTPAVVRRQLAKYSIDVRKRGGRNHVKVDLTPQLLEEIKAHGVIGTAKTLDVDVTTLYKALKKAGVKVRDTKLPEQPGGQTDAAIEDPEDEEDPSGNPQTPPQSG